MTDPAPRIPRISEAEQIQAAAEVFKVFDNPGWPPSSQHHVITTFAQHPGLAERFLVFNKHLLATSTLPIRLRQIAILRTAWTGGASYMWSSHIKLSLGVGLTQADFEAVKQGAGAPHWTEFERTIVIAVDQLRENQVLEEAVWQSLSSVFNHQQMLDLLFTIGTYTMLAMVFNSARIQREPELVALGEQYGNPPAR